MIELEALDGKPMHVNPQGVLGVISVNEHRCTLLFAGGVTWGVKGEGPVIAAKIEAGQFLMAEHLAAVTSRASMATLREEADRADADS